MAGHQQDIGFLSDVLVLTVRKSFWASKECEIFPNRIYTKIFYGYSQNRINSLFLALKGLVYIFFHRPKIILVGSAIRIVPWLVKLKKRGGFAKTKLIATDYANDSDTIYLDRIILYSRDWIEHRSTEVRKKCVFMPLPADGRFGLCKSTQQRNYIFAGGGQDRDFKSLIEAVSGLDVHLKIVTISPEKLGQVGQLPANCEVLWKMPLQEFLELMAGSLFVVVPLIEANYPHGQTTLVQALSLGKAVVVTRNVGIDEYMTDGKMGIIVSPGDVVGYREAILRLLKNPDLRQSYELNARAKAAELTYAAFSKRLVALCRELLAS